VFPAVQFTAHTTALDSHIRRELYAVGTVSFSVYTAPMTGCGAKKLRSHVAVSWLATVALLTTSQ
jgi:hypothetical protein